MTTPLESKLREMLIEERAWRLRYRSCISDFMAGDVVLRDPDEAMYFVATAQIDRELAALEANTGSGDR